LKNGLAEARKVIGYPRQNRKGFPMEEKDHKPGEIAPRSGEWGITGPRGGKTGEERTVAKGETFPPTPKPNQTYRMVRPARNKSGK
jgi:hypothetical protein